MIGSHQLLLISSSSHYLSGYLDHCEPYILPFLEGIQTILFIPFALPQGRWDDYTNKARARFAAMGRALSSIHEAPKPHQALLETPAVYVGGGNTFLLLKTLYEQDLLHLLQLRARQGMPYIGTSAGSNIAGPTIRTTNDMPIVSPPVMDSLDLVPFNINPHYLDPDPHSVHRGETRAERIAEFHEHHSWPVIGLREGAMLRIKHHQMVLQGIAGARLFQQGLDAQEYLPEADLSFLFVS